MRPRACVLLSEQPAPMWPLGTYLPPTCMQAYFNHAATTIQRIWRGHHSRTHIHSYSARRAYLAAIRLQNRVVRADMRRVRACA